MVEYLLKFSPGLNSAPMITTLLKVWMRQASPDEQDALAAAVGSSRGTLYQYAGGFLQASAERGAAIERATAEMAKVNPRLPVVYRTDTVSACRGCEYARACLGEKAIASEFPIGD